MEMFRFKTTCISIAALLASAVLAGCGGGGARQTAETATDSLLAANPFEDASGDLTPQEEFQQEPPLSRPHGLRRGPRRGPHPHPHPHRSDRASRFRPERRSSFR
jgi:hypothetical protein